MDITYIIPMSIFGLVGAFLSIEIFLFKKELLLKTVANPKDFENDLKIMVFASLFGSLYFFFSFFLTIPEIFVNFLGYSSGFLYVFVAFRIAKRYRKW